MQSLHTHTCSRVLRDWRIKNSHQTRCILAVLLLEREKISTKRISPFYCAHRMARYNYISPLFSSGFALRRRLLSSSSPSRQSSFSLSSVVCDAPRHLSDFGPFRHLPLRYISPFLTPFPSSAFVIHLAIAGPLRLRPFRLLHFDFSLPPCTHAFSHPSSRIFMSVRIGFKTARRGNRASGKPRVGPRF